MQDITSVLWDGIYYCSSPQQIPQHYGNLNNQHIVGVPWFQHTPDGDDDGLVELYLPSCMAHWREESEQ
eukprot:11466913-Prorocentrum_lima.AAC.1